MLFTQVGFLEQIYLYRYKNRFKRFLTAQYDKEECLREILTYVVKLRVYLYLSTGLTYSSIFPTCVGPMWCYKKERSTDKYPIDVFRTCRIAMSKYFKNIFYIAACLQKNHSSHRSKC